MQNPIIFKTKFYIFPIFYAFYLLKTLPFSFKIILNLILYKYNHE